MLELIHLSSKGGLEGLCLSELGGLSSQMALLTLNAACALQGRRLLVVKLGGIEGAWVGHELGVELGVLSGVVHLL